MSTLDDWNRSPKDDALTAVLACCGSRAFADAVVAARPYADIEELLERADNLWWSLGESDWLEAFACHPRLLHGQRRSSRRRVQQRSRFSIR